MKIFPCHVDVKLSDAKYPISKITPDAQVVISTDKQYDINLLEMLCTCGYFVNKNNNNSPECLFSVKN